MLYSILVFDLDDQIFYSKIECNFLTLLAIRLLSYFRHLRNSSKGFGNSNSANWREHKVFIFTVYVLQVFRVFETLI